MLVSGSPVGGTTRGHSVTNISMDLAGQRGSGGAARTAGLRSVTSVTRILVYVLICCRTPHVYFRRRSLAPFCC